MWNTLRTALFSRWLAVGAMALAYGTVGMVGMGCHHDHDDGYDRAAYHTDRDWDRHYDHHDWDRHDYDRDRY